MPTQTLRSHPGDGARGRARIAATLVACLAVLVVGAQAAAASSARVDIGRGAYEGYSSTWYYTPEEVRVAPGGTVTWHNPATHGLSGSADDHPTACVRETRRGRTNGDCPWSSFPLPPGASHTVTFPEEGTFQYVCTLHAWMVGTVVVGSGAPPSDEPDPEPTPTPSPTPTATAPASTPSPTPTATPAGGTDETGGSEETEAPPDVDPDEPGDAATDDDDVTPGTADDDAAPGTADDTDEASGEEEAADGSAAPDDVAVAGDSASAGGRGAAAGAAGLLLLVALGAHGAVRTRLT